MDQTRFDEVARVWSGGTRRGLLRLAGGTALGALLLGQLGGEEASAKCVKPGKKCKGKNGKKEKCCGGAKCQGGRCRCKTGGTSCGSVCCAPGQICLDGAPDVCVGTLEPGDVCDPENPLACESGKCECVTINDLTKCTCREEICLGVNGLCTDTSQCCKGFCSEFNNPPSCVTLD